MVDTPPVLRTLWSLRPLVRRPEDGSRNQGVLYDSRDLMGDRTVKLKKLSRCENEIVGTLH
ncbi:hypothetical protein PGTUg99_022112 [Puccinia graminis f. sp. tritici]|uniref:Uncharacterized protein n=1 Tax=Puccinia graminis f. sp. tritici TaxID=56615 RepID=A0A5B0QHK0_PUCGR|nr:hypothetical protein PGTUg99_022112 [Puccinia graminis f. sp. tritici]